MVTVAIVMFQYSFWSICCACVAAINTSNSPNLIVTLTALVYDPTIWPRRCFLYCLWPTCLATSPPTDIINLEVFKQISRMISKFYSKFSASCNGVSFCTPCLLIFRVLGIQQHPLLDSSLFSIFTLGLFEELLPFIKSIPKLPALTPL